jgi:hypothetical protein
MKYDRKSDFKSRFRFGKSLFSGKNEKKVIFFAGNQFFVRLHSRNQSGKMY